MQFSKFMPLACVAAFCVALISVRADDTPAQAAARAALDEKMREMDAQQQAGTNASSWDMVASPSSATTEQTVKPAPSTASQSIETVSVTTSAGSNAQAAAMAALDQKMHELDQQPSTNTEMPSPVSTTSSEAVPVQKPSVSATTDSANNSADQYGFKPLEAPPLPISAEKQAQLQALLAKYMADQITPEEYHTQRAAIIAAP